MTLLTHDRLVPVFRRLAERLAIVAPSRSTVELLLVGGAGGVLAGYLPRQRTTQDCDIMVWSPPDEDVWQDLERVAMELATELGLPERWLSRAAGVFDHRLLPGWEARRIEILQHAGLRLCAPARVDYLATKLLAGRDVDVDDVINMRMSAAEADEIRAAFVAWDPEHFAAGTIASAIELLEAIRHGAAPSRDDDHDDAEILP